jgi:glycosyltransferase involved in cell wall biosynthesis
MSSISSVADRPQQTDAAPAATRCDNTPAVSIAMATYNGAKYLRAQLDSLAAQTVAPCELVITDDGSTDATEQIVRDFGRAAPFPVRWHRNAERLGYKGNFVRAAGLCRAEVIAFCDQDDIWHADKLERVAAVFARDPEVLLAYHNARIFSDDGSRDELFYATPPGPAVAHRMTVPPWHFSHGFTQAMRKCVAPAGRFWPRSLDMYHLEQRCGHDVFFFHVASACGKIAYIDAPLVSYRQHAANVTGVGERAAPALLERWRARLEDRAGTYGYLARVAQSYADILTAFAADPDVAEALRPLAAEAALRWLDLERLYGARARVCGDGSLAQRMEAFGSLLKADSYGDGGQWSFGRKALLKDFVLGVLGAPLVHRFGYASSNGDPACRSVVAQHA